MGYRREQTFGAPLMSWLRPGLRVAVLVVMPLLLSACVTEQQSQLDGGGNVFEGSGFAEARGPGDPFERVNRAVFAFNNQLDRFIIEPVAISYLELTPEPIRESVHNILQNLRLPLSAVHSLLQGKFDEAGGTAIRFVANAVTLWLGDLSDDPYPDEDAGQTLAVAGFRDGGPFLMLPLLGPSNVRDALGRLIDAFIDPVGVAIGPAGGLARTAVDGIDTRGRVAGQLDELEASSIDFYATLRSLYLQNRESQIRDGDIDPLAGLLPTITVELGGDFGNDFGPAPQSATEAVSRPPVETRTEDPASEGGDITFGPGTETSPTAAPITGDEPAEVVDVFVEGGDIRSRESRIVIGASGGDAPEPENAIIIGTLPAEKKVEARNRVVR